jgi:hypothetical protein
MIGRIAFPVFAALKVLSQTESDVTEIDWPGSLGGCMTFNTDQREKKTNPLLGIPKCGFPFLFIEHCAPYTTTELAKHVGVPANISSREVFFRDRPKIHLI